MSSSTKNGIIWTSVSSFVQELVFDTFDATKLDRDMSICCNNKRYSMHGIFHDIVLEPYASMKYITYSVISHFFFKVSCHNVDKDKDVLLSGRGVSLCIDYASVLWRKYCAATACS